MTPRENQTPDSLPATHRTPESEKRLQPEENQDHGMERQPSLGEQISAHTNRPHKGDVGRPGTNEEVFQGSKTKELK